MSAGRLEVTLFTVHTVYLRGFLAINFPLYKSEYLQILDNTKKGLRVVNRTCHSINGRSLKVTRTLP